MGWSFGMCWWGRAPIGLGYAGAGNGQLSAAESVPDCWCSPVKVLELQAVQFALNPYLPQLAGKLASYKQVLANPPAWGPVQKSQ